MARELDLMGLLVSKGATQVLLSHQMLTICSREAFGKIFRVVTYLLMYQLLAVNYVPTTTKNCALLMVVFPRD